MYSLRRWNWGAIRVEVEERLEGGGVVVAGCEVTNPIVVVSVGMHTEPPTDYSWLVLFMQVQSASAAIYLCLLLLWLLYLCINRHRPLSAVHTRLLPLVLFTSVFELSLCVLVAHNSLSVLCLLLSAQRDVVERVGMFIVASGLGVVKQELGYDAQRLVLFGMGYFVVDLTYKIVAAVSGDREYSPGAMTLCCFLLLFNYMYYRWVVSSIFSVLAQPIPELSHTLYTRLKAVVTVTFLSSVVWLLFKL